MTTMTTYYIGAKPNKKSTTLYLTMKEKRELIAEINLTALYLLEYYLSVITKKSQIITDRKTATATGLSLRSVQDTRRLLIRHNWFYECKTTNSDTTIYLYCARKEGVYSKKYFNSLFGCDSIPEVFRKKTRQEFDNILAKSNLSTMETTDIRKLLDDHQGNVNSNKSQNYRW